MWPDRLTSAFPQHTSQLKPMNAAEGRKTKLLKAPAQFRSRHNPPRNKRTFQSTRADPLAHIHMLISPPPYSFADAILAAVWLSWKAPVSTSPNATAHKYNISCHTGCIYRQETAVRAKSKEFPREAITQLLLLQCLQARAITIFLLWTDFCRIANTSVTFLLCNHGKISSFGKKTKPGKKCLLDYDI